MATQTGTATSLSNFVSTIVTFAVANAGFAETASVTVNTNNTARILSKGGVFWVFETGSNLQTSNIRFFNCRMTYSAPVANSTFDTSTPVGMPGFCRMSTYGSPATFSAPYFLYTEGTAVHAVLEIFTNVFCHFSFGGLTKYGTWTGGEYVTASYMVSVSSGNYSLSGGLNSFPFVDESPSATAGNGYVRNSNGSNDENDFAPLGAGINQISGNRAQNAKMVLNSSFDNAPTGDDQSEFISALFYNSPNTFNQRSPLIPCYVRLRDQTSTSSAARFRLAGIVPGIRAVNMRNIDPKETVDTDWRVFPLTQKFGDTAIAPDSGNIGIAYQVVP